MVVFSLISPNFRVFISTCSLWTYKNMFFSKLCKFLVNSSFKNEIFELRIIQHWIEWSQVEFQILLPQLESICCKLYQTASFCVILCQIVSNIPRLFDMCLLVHRSQNLKQINIVKYVSKFLIYGAKMVDKWVESKKKICTLSFFAKSS